MSRLTRNLYIPFIDILKASAYTGASWKRIDKSTVFELTAGEKEEEFDYICSRDTETEILSNAIEFPQEIVCDSSSPVYEFLMTELYNLPVGSDCQTNLLLCFATSNSVSRAWRCKAIITSKVLNTVDGKISFTLKPVGTPEKGTYTITDGVPTFTQASTKTVTLAGANVTWKDVAGVTKTSVSGQVGEFAYLKPTATSGYSITSITDTAGNSYTLDSEGYLFLNLGNQNTITATATSSNKKTEKTEKTNKKAKGK